MTRKFEGRLIGYAKRDVDQYISTTVEPLQETALHWEREYHGASKQALGLEAEITRQKAEITRLKAEVARLSEPVNTSVGVSERMAKLLRDASEEARSIRDMAQAEADSTRGDLEARAAEVARAEALLNDRQQQESERAKLRRERLLEDAHREAAATIASATKEAARIDAEESAKRQQRQRRFDDELRTNWNIAEHRISTRERESQEEANRIISDAQTTAKRTLTESEEAAAGALAQYEDVVKRLSKIRQDIEKSIRTSTIRAVADSDVATTPE